MLSTKVDRCGAYEQGIGKQPRYGLVNTEREGNAAYEQGDNACVTVGMMERYQGWAILEICISITVTENIATQRYTVLGVKGYMHI